MNHRLEVERLIRLTAPAYATAVSANGQYAAVGTERGMGIYDTDGRELMRYPPVSTSLPVNLLALGPEMKQIVVGLRQGNLLRLDLKLQGDKFSFQERTLYWSNSDLRSLVVRGNKIGIGHLSPGLAVLSNEGQPLWRKHPEEGNATEGRIWSVTMDRDGKTMYAGSSKTGLRNELAAFDVRQGELKEGRRYLDGRITQLAVLPPEGDVAVVVTDDYGECRLLVYDNQLASLIWEREFEDTITAISSDPQQPLLVVSTGYDGRLHMLDVTSGESVAPVEPLNTLVNDLDMRDGRYIAAATENGQLVLLSYR